MRSSGFAIALSFLAARHPATATERDFPAWPPGSNPRLADILTGRVPWQGKIDLMGAAKGRTPRSAYRTIRAQTPSAPRRWAELLPGPAERGRVGPTPRDLGGTLALADITHQSVLDAVAEYDRLGQEEFLRRYGFERAQSYWLEREGRRYDSKAIVGVAHGYATGLALRSGDFVGGRATAKRRLEELGFRVVAVQNPPWDRREVILACDLVVDSGWRELRTGDPRVEELSLLLRQADIHPPDRRGENFRSPDAVSRKTTDLATAHPDYAGARTRGSAVDRRVIQEFIQDPAAMKAEANAIRLEWSSRDVPGATEAASPQVRAIEEAVELAAGHPKGPRRGQGFSTDQAAKSAIENHAMDRARAHYEKLGTVVNTSARKSWDYEVDIDSVAWRLEVKGTTGDPIDVILTRNEVQNANVYPHVALFVVSNITVTTDDTGHCTASGGRDTLYHPWALDPGDLTPLGFTYRLPPSSAPGITP